MLKPAELIQKILLLEKNMGRKRNIPKGPRIIDIDVIFWGEQLIALPELTVPHPSWSQRSFIVYPLLELPYSTRLQEVFNFPTEFDNKAIPLSDQI